MNHSQSTNDLPESLKYFKCKACGEKRLWTDINTFKHPIVEKDSTKIYAYYHFNYCYDNLICYLKASRKEHCKYE